MTIFNWNISCVQLIHNILNHKIHLNDMYLFRASQRTDSLHYKDKLFNNVWGRNICLVLKFYKTQKTTA